MIPQELPDSFLLSASWVLPVVSPPLQDGAVFISGGKIGGVGPSSILKERYSAFPIFNYPDEALMPGLVNVHTHLEYTALGTLLAGNGFIPWILDLIEKSRAMGPEERLQSALLGCRKMLENGITTVGEVSFSGETSLEAMKQTGLKGTIYLEIFGTRDRYDNEAFLPIIQRVERLREKAEGTGIRIGLSPHSPYTVSPALWRRVMAYAEQEGLPLTYHLSESLEETQLIEKGTGPFKEVFYPALGITPPSTIPSGLPPGEYLGRHGLLSDALAVHGLEFSEKEMALLMKEGVALALCPGSNLHLHGKLPNVAEMARSGLLLGLGTDSLASNPSLDLLREMKLLQGALRGMEGTELLKMGTANGARLLGLDTVAGTLEPGKKADLIGVSLGGTLERNDLLNKIFGGKVLFTLSNGRLAK